MNSETGDSRHRKRSRRGNNEGSVYRYRNGWAGQVSMPDGTRPTVYGRTKDDVLAEITKIRRAADDGVPIASTRITLGAYLDQWVTATLPSRVAAGTLAESTVHSYAENIRLHITPVLGRHQLKALSPANLRAWMTKKLTEPSSAAASARRERDAARVATEKAREAAGGTSRRRRAAPKPAPESKEPKPLSARTVRYLHSILRAALADAVRDELIVRNVAHLVAAPKVRRKPPKPLNVEESRQVLAVAMMHRLGAMWLLMLSLGLHKGEVLALRWQAIDLDGGEVSIERKLRRRRGEVDPDTGRRRGELVEDEFGKTEESIAVLALPLVVVAALRAHKEQQDSDREDAALWEDPGLVFTTGHGTAVDPRNVNRMWDRICADANVRRIKVHDLRHTAATLLFREGADMKEIQALLRHTRLATTADIYTHVLDEVRRGTADRMDSLLGRIAVKGARLNRNA